MTKFNDFYEESKPVACKTCDGELHGPVVIQLGEIVFKRMVCDQGHIEELRVD